MNETYVIDGTNVCWWYSQAHPKEISALPLLSVLVALLENGDDFFCVFDAPITNTLEEHGRTEESAILDNMLKKHPKRFYRVTASTRADGAILHDAEQSNRSVITNDIYKDYNTKYEWLRDRYTQRLLQGNLHPSGLITIDKLPYGKLRLCSNAKDADARIQELIESRDAPAVSELDRQIAQRQQVLASINGQISTQELKLDAAITKHAELTARAEELSHCTTDLESVRADLSRLITERDHVEGTLKILLGVLDYEAVCKQRSQNMDDLSRQIADLDGSITEKRATLAELEAESRQYIDVLEQKKRAEDRVARERADDQTCISRANSELSAFLEPYGVKIPFKGSSWDVAVKALKVFYERERTCTNCYKTNGSWKKECFECHNGMMVANPESIWNIINRCAPKKTAGHSPKTGTKKIE